MQATLLTALLILTADSTAPSLPQAPPVQERLDQVTYLPQAPDLRASNDCCPIDCECGCQEGGPCLCAQQNPVTTQVVHHRQAAFTSYPVVLPSCTAPVRIPDRLPIWPQTFPVTPTWRVAPVPLTPQYYWAAPQYHATHQRPPVSYSGCPGGNCRR